MFVCGLIESVNGSKDQWIDGLMEQWINGLRGLSVLRCFSWGNQIYNLEPESPDQAMNKDLRLGCLKCVSTW